MVSKYGSISNKESQACRAEASYAYKCKKSLLFVKFDPKFMGTQLYYELIDGDTYTDQLSFQTPCFQKRRSHAKFICIDSKRPWETIYWNWDNEDVRAWLASTALVDMDAASSTISQLHGRHLVMLKNWEETSPEKFFDFCESSLLIRNQLNLLEFCDQLHKLW